MGWGECPYHKTTVCTCDRSEIAALKAELEGVYAERDHYRVAMVKQQEKVKMLEEEVERLETGLKYHWDRRDKAEVARLREALEGLLMVATSQKTSLEEQADAITLARKALPNK